MKNRYLDLKNILIHFYKCEVRQFNAILGIK